MLSDFIVLIGARKGSKRIYNKNLRNLNGIPLIVHSIKIGNQLTDKVYVSTDSMVIGITANVYKARVIMRNKGVSEDNSTDYDWISSFLKEYEKREGKLPRNIVFLRPTTPLRDLYVVEQGLHHFSEIFDSMRSVEQIPEAIEKTFRVEDNKLFPSCAGININDTNNPNQVFPKAYKANGYIDILKTETILNTKSLYGNNIQAFITKPTIEIDTLEDLERANYEICKNKYQITS